MPVLATPRARATLLSGRAQGGGSNPFADPLSIFGASLVAWWDLTNAATVVVGGASAINTVADLSGNGWTLTRSGAGITYSTSQAPLNNKGCAVFSGTGAVLQTSASLILPQPCTVAVLFATSNPIDYNGFLYDGDIAEAGSRMIFSPNYTSGGSVPLMYAGLAQAPIGPALSVSTPYISVAQWNGASSKHALNGAANVTVNPGTSGIINGFQLGGDGGNGPISDSIARVVIINRTITEIEHQKLEGCLSWG